MKCLTTVTDEGEVLSWGHGGHGQLGHPTLQNHRIPLAIKALSDERIVHIACGGSTSAAISGEIQRTLLLAVQYSIALPVTLDMWLLVSLIYHFLCS